MIEEAAKTEVREFRITLHWRPNDDFNSFDVVKRIRIIDEDFSVEDIIRMVKNPRRDDYQLQGILELLNGGTQSGELQIDMGVKAVADEVNTWTAERIVTIARWETLGGIVPPCTSLTFSDDDDNVIGATIQATDLP